MRHRPKILLALVATSLLSACGGLGVNGPMVLQAQLEPIGGSDVEGLVTFHEIDAGVLVEATVNGVTRRGNAFHIHQNGDCANPGGHFNPSGAQHGKWSEETKHVGDLPMLVADAAGRARLSALVPGPSVRSGRNAILGRAVVVHEGRDDYFTQPDGDGGRAVACGIIQRP